MRFEVSSTSLLSKLQSASRVIAAKNSMPILDSFLFSLKGNTLTITASDIETRLVTSIEVINPEGEGLFAVSAKILLDPLKELPEQPLRFDINDDNLEIFIHFENGKYNFIGQQGETYPQQKSLNEESGSISLPASVLLNGISRSIFASADDELRPVMNGVCFDMQPYGLVFVASDGHKLVRVENKKVKSEEPATFILPKKPANLLKSLLAKTEELVQIRFDENNAYIRFGSFEMICRLLEGRYPNYNSVIPKDSPNKLIIDRLSFLNALKRVSVFSSQSSSLIKISLLENEIIVSAQDIDFSTAAEEKIACQYTGMQFNIGFKANFLIEMLANINASDIVFELTDSSRAGVIVPLENEEDEELLMLLMPMMLND